MTQGNHRNLPQEDYYINQYLEMYIEDGILYATYMDGIVIDLDAAKNVLESRLNFLRGRTYASFVDGRGVKYWTKEAREFQATKENNIGMNALAMYVNSHALK